MTSGDPARAPATRDDEPPGDEAPSRAAPGPRADTAGDTEPQRRATPVGAHLGIPDDGRPDPTITRVGVCVLTVPTDAPESDGTFAWDRTTMVLVELEAGGERGLGYTYAAGAAGALAVDTLAPIVLGGSVWASGRLRDEMVNAVRNLGRPGVGATAISAVDTALWDLRARLLNVSLPDLLGRCRDSVPAYGSGGFTSYDDARLAAQLGGWAADGFGMVKMKIGRDPDDDPRRVDVAREAIGAGTQLFVDANGALDRRAAVRMASLLGERDVRWFEEPVTSDDPAGLRFVRDHAPAGMAVAAGEYCWGPDDVRHLIEPGAVDVLQLDATRCLGISGVLAGAAAAAAWHVPVSGHCAPALHASVLAAVPNALHLEWFHDHARIERLLFDGAPDVRSGRVLLDPTRPGLGLELNTADAEPFIDWRWSS